MVGGRNGEGKVEVMEEGEKRSGVDRRRSDKEEKRGSTWHRGNERSKKRSKVQEKAREEDAV